ncbi:tetratricopeptide repeat protein [Spirillospora sp. NPDC052242]
MTATDPSPLVSGGRALPLPPDPPSPVPAEVERGLAAYRAGDAPAARALLTPPAEAGRTAAAGHAAMALAGVELGDGGLGGPCRAWLERVAGGEDPWLGPLAAVLLHPHLEAYTAPDPDATLLRSLAARLTGDPDTARKGFERAADAQAETEGGDLAHLFLGELLLHSGEPDAALGPLRHARRWCDRLFSAYACHLEGHVLTGRGDVDEAGEALQEAHSRSHPANGGSAALHPWAALRFGELLAGRAFELDLVYEQVENSGVSEGVVVREPFESALLFDEVSRPALVEVGFHLFPSPVEFEKVHAALDRLRTWSDERYERGRRLVLALHEHVEDSREDDRVRGLADLWRRLDLPPVR